MARQYFPWCPCCKQCTRRYNFTESPSFGWDLVDDPSGSTPVHIAWDHVNYRIDIDGEGSATVRVTGNPKTIYVAAEVLSLTSGSAGVTIRRVDSAESISLWWMGGTSYELRHGTTVLESIVGSGSGEIKLELAAPREATTDVLVYIGGTLAHTETAVAFVMPDVLHLGMVIDGDAAFEWVEVSPCPVSECEPVSGSCFGVGRFGEPDFVPRVYHVSIPWPSDHGSNSWPDPYDCTDVSFDVLYNQDVYFRLNDSLNIVLFDEISGQWVDYSLSECAYAPVVPGRVAYEFSNPFFPVADPSRVMPIPSGKLAMMKAGFCYAGTMNNPQPVAIYPHSSSYSTGDNPDDNGWQLTGDSQNVGTELAPVWQYRYRVTWGPSGTVSYASGWFDFGDDTPTRESTTLSLVTNDSIYSGWDPTVTLEPNGGSKEVVRSLIGCGDETCDPPVTPQPGQPYCMIVTLVDEADNPITYSVPMDVGYNETTGSWEWTGFIGSWEHPTCGMMDSSSYKIHCVEPEEGASKQWVLDITTSNGTSRIPLSDDPGFGPVFDGTLDVFCPAETWDAFVMFPNAVEETTDIFGCGDTACHVEGYCISGVASCDMGTCANNAFGNHLGSTSSNPPGVASKIGPAFTGPYPIAVPSGHMVWLWEDGGGIHLGVYNGTTLIEEATPIDIDCGQVEKTFSLNDPAFACCSGFGGVVITLTPCGGPIVHV